MKKMTVAIILALAVAACGGKKADKTTPTNGSAAAGSDMGSAAPAGSGAAPAGSGSAM